VRSRSLSCYGYHTDKELSDVFTILRFRALRYCTSEADATTTDAIAASNAEESEDETLKSAMKFYEGL
jgi:hypothetical protein